VSWCEIWEAWNAVVVVLGCHVESRASKLRSVTFAWKSKVEFKPIRNNAREKVKDTCAKARNDVDL
jgi:hypothetical protein